LREDGWPERTFTGSKPRDVPNNRGLVDTVRDLRRAANPQHTGWLHPVDNALALPEGDPGSELGGVVPIYRNNWSNVDSSKPAGFHIEGSEVKFKGHIRGGQPGTYAWVMPTMYRPDPDAPDPIFVVPNGAGGYAHLRIEASTGRVYVDSISI